MNLLKAFTQLLLLVSVSLGSEKTVEVTKDNSKKWKVHIGIEDIRGFTQYVNGSKTAQFIIDDDSYIQNKIIDYLYIALASPKIYFSDLSDLSLDYILAYRTVTNTHQLDLHTQNIINSSSNLSAKSTGIFLTPSVYYKWKTSNHSYLEASIGLGLGLLSSEGTARGLITDTLSSKTVDEIYSWKEENLPSISVHMGLSYVYALNECNNITLEVFADELHSSRVHFSTLGARIYYSYLFDMNFFN